MRFAAFREWLVEGGRSNNTAQAYAYRVHAAVERAGPDPTAWRDYLATLTGSTVAQSVAAQGLYQEFLDGKPPPARYHHTRQVEHHEPAELQTWRLLVGKLFLAMNEGRKEWPSHQQVRPKHFAQAIRSDLHRGTNYWRLTFERMFQPARGYPDPVAPATIGDDLEPVLARLLSLEYGDMVPDEDDPLFVAPQSNGVKLTASVGQIERAVEAARALGARLDETLNVNLTSHS